MSFFSRIRRVLAIVLAVVALVLLVCAAIAMLELGPQLLPTAISTVKWGYFIFAAVVFGSLAVMADPEEAMSIIGRAFDSTGRLAAAAINSAVSVADEIATSASKLLLKNPIFLAACSYAIFKLVNRKEPSDAIS